MLSENRTLGRQVATARRQQGVSQVRLSVLARTSPTTIRLFERYGLCPRPEIAERIAAALGLDLVRQRRGAA